MPLQRIRASSLGAPDTKGTDLRAEGLRLAEGRVLLNRRTEAATALIVANGRVSVGVADDDALLDSGEGVLLPEGTVYSLRAEEESLLMVFALE